MRAYSIRRFLRAKSPWWLLNAGLFRKGKNCEAKGSNHEWYNIDNEKIGCYYCRVVKIGRIENDQSCGNQEYKEMMKNLLDRREK